MTSRHASTRVAFITGGNSGIGLAIALALARAGMDVAIFARRADRNAAARALIEAEGVRCLPITGDVTDEAAVRQAIVQTVETLGGLHYGVNNAGAMQPVTALSDLPVEEYTRQFDVNVKGVFLGTRHMIRAMANNGGGAICNIASTGGLIPRAGQVAYA
ncbi:MAG: SDR family NAD(P)-dependent oxidoreductase, partial [Sphingomonadales bacterium]